MFVVTPDPLVVALAEALGLDPSKTARFVLDVSPDRVVTYYAEAHPTDSDLNAIVDAVKKHRKPRTVEVEGSASIDDSLRSINDSLKRLSQLVEGWGR